MRRGDDHDSDSCDEAPDMSDLYESDTVAWAEQQGALLRRVAAGERLNVTPDWPNIAEEIETLGKTQARELASRIAVVLEHLIKLAASPASEPRAAWRATIRRERGEIETLLDDAPSLRARVPAAIESKMARARADAAAALADKGEVPCRDIGGINYGASEVLGDWFP
jgi:hypothetical protein